MVSFDERFVRAFALFIVALLLVFGGSANAQPVPLRVDVITSDTGGFAFIGARSDESLRILQATVNASGGINGRPLQFVFSDDQSSPVVAVQLANAAIARGAQVILGPLSGAACAAVVPLLAASGPLNYCLSPVITGPPGSYVFSTGAGTAANNVAMVRFFRNENWRRIAILAANDASCTGGEHDIDAALATPENRDMRVVAREHFAPNDLSIAAQVAQIKAANAQAILTCASGTIFGTVVRTLHDAGVDLPTSSSAASMVYDQLKAYGTVLPHNLYFATLRGFIPDPQIGKGPIKDNQERFFAAFRAAHVRPEYQDAFVWDPAMIVVDALRHAGPNPTAGAMHAYIEALRSWAGIAGIYYFSDNSQRGISGSALQIVRWDSTRSAFSVAQAPGRLPFKR
jgi:branched-chain amino acid transport system substrate-binding protein